MSAQETIWAAVGVFRAWIARYGVPRALYTDWKNVYVRAATEAERLTATVPLTQFGRMCATLGITIIPASSPQANGRIERHHGTHQDRLVKKLRRKGIGDVAPANTFLEVDDGADHNGRFARDPASPEDFHRAVPRGLPLAAVFRLEATRTVSPDWVVRYANRHFQVERQSHLPPARSTVQVFEDATGQIDIRYRDRVMRGTEIPCRRRHPVRRGAVRRDAAIPSASVVPGPAAIIHGGSATRRWAVGIGRCYRVIDGDISNEL